MMGTSNPCRLSKKFLHGIIVVLFITNGLNAETCRKGCTKSDTEKLKYLPGNVYEYEFNSIITIGLNNNDGDETSLKLTGNANIYPEGNCDYILKLDKIHVQTTREQLNKELTNGITKPVQFKLTNGELDTKICTDINDNDYGLNIKRSIISMLQSTDINNKYETDIFGQCPTLKSIDLQNGNIITTRNLNSCNYRENIINGLMNGIINDKSNIKSSKYLLGDYTRKQKLINGIYNEIDLIEEYKFNPIPNNFDNNQIDLTKQQQTMINVNVKTNMKLKTNGPAQQLPQINKNNYKLNTIIFQHPASLNTQNLDITKKQLDKTINSLNDYAKTESATNFNELIRLMRYSDLNTLMTLSEHQHQNKNLARKVYLDALFRVSTSESVKAIIKQLTKMNEKEKRFAFLSFNLVESVTKDVIKDILPLLTPNSPREAYLSIGNLVNKYCRDENCDESKEINQISKKFIDNLKECKDIKTKQDEDRIIGVLKGIRNSNIIAKTSTQQLIKCVQNDRSTRLRVTAIQTFIASSCNEQLQNEAIKLLQDYNEDSEIRIEAYLIAVQCPNPEIANQIANIVNNEKVNQVGSFITTHLKSIRDSTDFTRESQRYHLSNIRIIKKFPIDPKRYSFNHELSYAIDTLGIGASIDYNLIYSQNGFLPRSAKLNLTNVLFGQSYNAIELNVRQENLENILEYYFGPKGFLNKEPQEIFDQFFIGNDQQTNPQRTKRSIVDDTQKFSKKYKTYGHNKYNNDINLDLSLKLFGSELTFLSFGNKIPTSIMELTKEMNNVFINLKKGLKNYHNKFEDHTMFYDIEYVYPTGIGLPLEIIGQGTTTTKIDLSTEIDVQEILDNPINSKVHIKLIPSFNVNINGKLRIDGGVLSTGLLVQTNLHSSSGGDINVQLINDGNGFNVDLKLPRDKFELLQLKNNIDFYVAEQNKELKLISFKSKPKHRIQPNCFDQLQLFGMTICYTSDYQTNSNLLYPFTGPMYFDLTLQTERHINIQGLYHMKNEYQKWELLFNTPNSQKSHKTTLDFELGVKPKLYSRLNFDNPDKQLAIEMGLQNDDNEFNLYGKLEIDHDVTLRKIGFKKNGNEYIPLIQMTSRDGVKNDIAGYKADGKVIVTKEPGTDVINYDFQNFRLIRPNNGATIINGKIINDNGFKSVLHVQDGQYRYKIDAHCNIEQDNGFAVGAFITNQDKPDMTTGGSLLLNVGDKVFKHELKLQSGEHEFNLHNEYEYGDDKTPIKNCKFSNQLQIKQKQQITISGKLNGEFTDKLRNYEFELKRNDKLISILHKLQYDIKNFGDYNLNLLMKLNRHFIDIKSQNDIKNGKNNIDNILITSWGTRLTCKGDINQNFKINDIKMNLNGLIQIQPKEKELNWLLNFLNSNDKNKFDFKLLHDNKNDVQINFDMNRGYDKPINGQINIKVYDLLKTNGNFKYNQKNGNGDLQLLIELIKTKNQIQLNSKYLLLAPKYNIDTTLVFNNDKKIVYKTENIIDLSKFVTKNLLELDTEKYEFNSNGMYKGTNFLYDSDVDGKFDLKLSTGREINGILKRKLSVKQKSGLINIELKDQLPNNKKRLLTINGQLTDYIPKEKLFNVLYNIQYIDFTDKQLNCKLNVNNLHLNEQFNKGKFDIELNGSMLPEQINFSINLDEYCPVHAKFNLNSKYGNKLNVQLNGNYQLLNDNKPFKYDIQTIINIPNGKYKLITLNSNGKYKIPLNDNDFYNSELNLLYKYDNEELKFMTQFNGNNDNGDYLIETNLPLQKHIYLKGNYVQKLYNNDENGKYQYNIHYKYNKEIDIKKEIYLDYHINQLINFNYKLFTNYDTLKHIELQFKGLNDQNKNEINSVLQFQHNDDKYNLNVILNLSDIKYGIDLKYDIPNKTGKLYGQVEYITHNNIKLILNCDNIIGLDLQTTGTLQYQQFDDFTLIIDVNSKKLNLNQIHIDIGTIKTPTDNQIKFNINNANENILNGLAQFTRKQEKYKNIIKGQGNIKYYNDDYTANIILINQIYTEQMDNENGFSYNFNGKFGPKNFISTIKLTNKNYHIRLATCEEKKQCTYFEIKSVIHNDLNDLTQGQHNLLILINLLELGYPYEFELTTKTLYKNYKVQHDIDMNIKSNNNNKYELQAKLQSDICLIKLKLPKRAIVMEIKNVIPKNNLIFGKYENSLTFYFDKDNKPNDKTELTFVNNLNGINNNNILNYDFIMKLQHTNIRTLSVNGKFNLNHNIENMLDSSIEFDVFNDEKSKIIGELNIINNNIQQNNYGYNITTDWKLYSNGLNFKYLLNTHMGLVMDTNKNELTNGIYFESIGNDMKFSQFFLLNRNEFEYLLNGFNYDIIKLNCQLNYPSNKLKLSQQLQLFNTKPIEMICEIEPKGGKFILKRDNMFMVNSDLKIGKELTFMVNGYGKKLLNGKIMLDTANLLTTTYEVEDENVRSFLHDAEMEYKKDRENAIKEIDEKFSKLSSVVVERIQNVKQNLPDLRKLRMSYEQNLNSIVKEFEEDPALKEIIELYRKLYDSSMKIMSEFIKNLTELYENLQKIVIDFYENLSLAFKEQIIPILQELLTKLTELFSDLYLEAMKILGTLFERTIKSLKQFKEYIIDLSKPIGELLKPIYEIVNELLKNIINELTEFYKDFNEYIKRLPSIKEFYNNVYNKLIKLYNIDELLNILREIFAHLEQWQLSKECHEFLTKLYKYIEMKLRNTKELNDLKEIEEISISLMQAIQSIIKILSDNLIDTTISSPISYLIKPIPFTYDTFINLPIQWLDMKFSIFNYLRNEKLNIFKTLLLYRIPLLDIIPPYKLYGHISDGQHIFTFDGKHLTLPGQCKYILAQDYINNNFSVIGNIQNGKLKSIILIDKLNHIEINDKSQITLNGKQSEYPIHINDIHAWRRYYTISILTEYGVKVMCSSDLRVCHIIVNGYYTGKVRGLLGNGNNERYDDFTKPDGIIIDNYADFGNSYSIGNCQPIVSNPDLLTHDNAEEQHDDHHEHHHHMTNNDNICNELFNYDSNLLFGYLFINPLEYREACNHAIYLTKDDNKKLDAACNIALTYASSAHIKNIPLEIPEQCLQCKVDTKLINIGDDFKSHVPNNQADLVFIIDTQLNEQLLKDFVQNLLKDIREQLKQRGLTNINLSIIGYNNKQIYPQLFTTNGKYNDFNGETLLKMNLNGPEYDNLSNVGIEKINDLLMKLQTLRDILQTTANEALLLALEYPFRSGAAKSIIIINNDSYEDFNALLSDFGSTAVPVTNYVLQKLGLTFHYIGNIEKLSLLGDTVPVEKIVGFNKRVVATPDGRDAKKRSKLQYTNNVAFEMIQENNGWIFAIQNFDKQKTQGDKMKFTQQITSSIADQLFKTNIDYVCQCTVAYGLHAEEKCLAVTTTFDANKKLPK